MKKNIFIFVIIFSGYLFSSCTPKNDKKTKSNINDVLELIYTTADEFNMKVISDIDLRGGDLYQKSSIEELVLKSDTYIKAYYKKYKHHPSFWGWYLNNEINPIENTDVKQSAFWRTIWKSVVDRCHEIAPGTKVTISPFFLLDKESLRGFKYLEPAEYEEWWYNTMKETGIDILMLQDSGAEHLSLFTLKDREPFFAAFANACRKAEKEFWLNVETGQVEAKDWEHALQMERDFNRAWTFTEIDWLKQKLNLASRYATGIINWGYYPLMNPKDSYSNLTIQNVDGQDVDLSKRKANYHVYKEYVNHLSYIPDEEVLTLPKLNGTLWFLPKTIEEYTKDELAKAVKQEIQNQKDIGFSILWICNTPDHFVSE
jgi:hypothetical protein